VSGRDGDGAGAPDSSETAETDTAPPVARRDVLKGLAGAGTIAGGLTDVGRALASPGRRSGRYVVGIDPGSGAAAEPTETLSVSTLDLVVENAEGGIRSYAVTIEVPETDLLTVEDVTLAGDPVQQSVDIRPDGSRATVEAGMGGNAHGAGDVRIAEVTLHTRGEGSVPVALPEVVVVDDAAAVPYDIASVDGAAVTVAEGVGPPPVVGTDPPRDLDGDGLYRDINGDGEFTISDVQAFFDHRREDVVLNNAEYFNFAGGDPPDVSLADVQALFEALIAEDPDAAAAAGLDGEDAADLRRALAEGD